MIEKILGFFVRSQLLVWLIVIGTFAGGLVSLASLQREAYPRVNFHAAEIRTIFPGAAPADVEERVTIPLEEEIREVEGLKRVRSISRHSVSEIVVEVDLNESNPDRVLDEVRRALDRVTDLPAEVVDRPVFNERKTGSIPVLEVSLYGAASERELAEVAEFYENELEKVKGVARVNIFGERDHEWRILVNPGRMRANSLSLMDVSNALAGRNVNIPGGAIESETARNIRTTGEFSDIAELNALPVRSNETGGMTRLGSIARFEEAFERPEMLARTNGQRALNLDIVKRERADIVRTTDAVLARIEELRKIRPIQAIVVNDEAQQTRRRLDVVTSNAVMGFIIVVAMLMAFLNFRTALITSLSLPLVILGTMLVFPIYDVTFNMISMMGLIIALGMLVDNSIVIAENVHRYREQGLAPFDAAVKGASELVTPIIGSFLTTIAAFLPMIFMSGIMGRFIWQIPFLVIVSLTVSLLESFFLLPARLARYAESPRGPAPPARFRRWLDEAFERLTVGFSNFVARLVARPFLALGGMTVVLIIAMGAMSQMRFSLFPKEEVEQFLIKAEFDPSLRVEQTMERMNAIEGLVRKLPPAELITYTVKGGLQQQNAGDPLARFGEHLAMVQVFLTPEATRERTARDIIDALEPEIRRQTPGLKMLYIEELVPSPPIGAAITVAVEGPDYAKLQQISAEIREYLSSLEGVKNIADDYKTGREEVVVRLNEERAAQAGVSDSMAALMVRTAFEGFEASTLRRGRNEVTLRVLYDDEFRASAESLRAIEIPNRAGLYTTLGSISTLESSSGPESLSHFDFERAVTITADVDEKRLTSSDANRMIFEKFADISERYPGYALRARGEQEETLESMASLARAGLAAFFAIFAIIALTFNSPLRAFIIMATIPLGLIGIVAGFLISGKALSFLALIGIIGLAGVQVNAGIMLVEFIDQHRQSGLSPAEALVEAARQRFRPILLTSLTTMGGLFPTAYSLGGSDPVLIPMTLALAWGLASGTFGSLTFIPTVFAAGYKLRDLWRGRRGPAQNDKQNDVNLFMEKLLKEEQEAARRANNGRTAASPAAGTGAGKTRGKTNRRETDG